MFLVQSSFRGGTEHTVMPTQEFLVQLSKKIQFQIVALRSQRYGERDTTRPLIRLTAAEAHTNEETTTSPQPDRAEKRVTRTGPMYE